MISLFLFQLKNPNRPAKFRLWDPHSMAGTYKLVKEQGCSAYKVSMLHGAPLTTLRDRVVGGISIDVTKSVPGPVISMEEARLTCHIKDLAAVGYGYTRPEVITLVSDYATYLGKRCKQGGSFDAPMVLAKGASAESIPGVLMNSTGFWPNTISQILVRSTILMRKASTHRTNRPV